MLEDPLCRLCRLDNETTSHIIFNCVSVAVRLKLFVVESTADISYDVTIITSNCVVVKKFGLGKVSYYITSL